MPPWLLHMLTVSSVVQRLQPPALMHHSSTAISVSTVHILGNTSVEAAIVVFGGQLCCGTMPGADHALSTDAWVYAFESGRWAKVVQPAAANSPTPRMKHSCAPSSVFTSALVCFGGVGAAGQALSDAWLLVLGEVDLQTQEAQAEWVYLRVPETPGPRHSANLLGSPSIRAASEPHTLADIGNSESFVLLGGSADADAAPALLPPWMLSLSFEDACGWQSAAWHVMYPRALPEDVAAAPQDALVTFDSHSVAPSAAGSEADHLQLQQALSVQTDALLDAGCATASSALQDSCPGAQQTKATCLTGAQTADISVSVNASVLVAAQAVALLQELRVIVQDSSLQTLPAQRVRVVGMDTALAAARAASAADTSATDAIVEVQLDGVLHAGDSVQAEVIATAYGIELGRTTVQLAGSTSSAGLMLQPAAPLTVALDGADAGINASLLLWNNGSMAAWAQLHAGPGQVSSTTWRWQVRSYFPQGLLHIALQLCRSTRKTGQPLRRAVASPACPTHVAQRTT